MAARPTSADFHRSTVATQLRRKGLNARARPYLRRTTPRLWPVEVADEFAAAEQFRLRLERAVPAEEANLVREDDYRVSGRHSNNMHPEVRGVQ